MPSSVFGRLVTAVCVLMVGGLQAGDLSYGIEVKANWRDSDHIRLGVPFEFPDFFLPEGETSGFLETVDAGDHFEFSRISFFLEGTISGRLHGRIKLDTIDRYDRNPTSGDNETDIDEAWLELGRDTFSDEMPEGSGWYLRLGKFGKFERQDDRNLESYGLISTMYNRFEDAGLELGVDMGRHFYLKGSYTNGNPVFMRDPNALAGDNGLHQHNPFINPFPNPELKSGIVMFYDAEVEDFDYENPESGLALGFKAGDDAGVWIINVMAFAYRRDLGTDVGITGTFYGGDLDLLDGPVGSPGGLPLEGNEKEEQGANLWLYAGSGTLFAQYVDSEMAGLASDGFEVEGSWDFEINSGLGAGGKPIFPFIRPALRYSRWDAGFVGVGTAYPTPSVWWDWEKLDVGINFGLYPGLMLTLEQAQTEFETAGGWRENNETLATLSWRWGGGSGE